MFPYRVKYNESEYHIQINNFLYKIHQKCQNTFEMLEMLENFEKIYFVICINCILHLFIYFVDFLYFCMFLFVGFIFLFLFFVYKHCWLLLFFVCKFSGCVFFLYTHIVYLKKRHMLTMIRKSEFLERLLAVICNKLIKKSFYSPGAELML